MFASFFQKILTFYQGQGVKKKRGENMKIKEIEERTHLSSKTIRFYEKKGLLEVTRDQSGYREYNEDDIIKLQNIKLYRKCGLSLQEIREAQCGEKNLDDILYNKISEFDKQDLEISNQKDLCLDVIKAKGNYKDLYGTVDVLESNEYKDMIDDIYDNTKPSLGKQVVLSLILLGPILNCYFMLSQQKYEQLGILIFFVFLSGIFLAITWKNFLQRYKFYNESWKKGIFHTIMLVLIIIIGIIIIIGLCMGLAQLQICLFMNDDVFIMSEKRIFTLSFMMMGFECFLIFLSFLSRFLQHPDYQSYDFVIPFIQKHKFIVLMINLLLCYIGFIHVDVFTQDHIISHSFFHPQGIVYSYQEIEKIDTGFYEHGFFMLHEKGDFYYDITMKDGKVIQVEDTQTIPEYEEDTYMELVVLDQKIMKYHPIKNGDDRFSQYLMMDQIYIDRFLSIVHHQ